MRYSTTAITSVNTSYVRRGKAAMRFYDAYPPYVSVGERRAKAEKKLQQLRKKHPNLEPVIIAGNAPLARPGGENPGTATWNGTPTTATGLAVDAVTCGTGLGSICN
jgi:hypothetical protein